MAEPTWQKNAPSQIVLNSIFAALVAVLLVFVIPDSIADWLKFVEVALLGWSFLLFAISAEETTNALDEKDVRKYVYYMLWYNVGVILLGFALTATVSAHFTGKLATFTSRHSGVAIQPFVIESALFVLATLLLWHWVHDFFWLLFAGTETLNDYLAELEDKQQPTPDPSVLMRLFYYYRRSKRDPTLPHEGVYARLKPSPIDGVGVFAIRDIPLGTTIFDNDDSGIIWINQNDLRDLQPEMQKLYDDFYVVKGAKYGCPKNFNVLTVGWYLNESRDKPNVVYTNDQDFMASRDIKSGEELLVDYSTYSDSPNPGTQVGNS